METIEQVPESVAELSPLVDYHIELLNDPKTPDIEIVTPGETWEHFTAQWIQYVYHEERNVNERNDNDSLFLFYSLSFPFFPHALQLQNQPRWQRFERLFET